MWTFTQIFASSPGAPPKGPQALGLAVWLLLILLLGLGALLVLTLIRASLKRAARMERKPRSGSVKPSAWSVAGQRAQPADDNGRGDP